MQTEAMQENVMRGEVVARRRWPMLLLVAVVCLVLGGATVWATLTVLKPAEDPLSATDYTFVEVVEGEIGSSIRLNTVAEWTSALVGANRAAGTITAVSVTAGDEVSQGSALYSVDLQPVFVAQGVVPAFRDIGFGVAGPDVAQLQTMLTALGHYTGTADGKVGAGTVRSINAWQKSLGVAQTGVVALSDIIFVPTLPLRVSLDDQVIQRGALLIGGEEVVRGLPASPAFTMPVTDAQAGMLTVGVRVEVMSPDGTQWHAVAGAQSRDKNDTAFVLLEGAGDATICGDECAQVPVTGQASLASQVITVETETGLVVPSSALITEADGQVAVIGTDGIRQPVEILASAKGMSVITGVDAGTKVRVPAAVAP